MLVGMILRAGEETLPFFADLALAPEGAAMACTPRLRGAATAAAGRFGLGATAGEVGPTVAAAFAFLAVPAGLPLLTGDGEAAAAAARGVGPSGERDRAAACRFLPLLSVLSLTFPLATSSSSSSSQPDT